jgi:hypothetical protein
MGLSQRSYTSHGLSALDRDEKRSVENERRHTSF